MNYLISGGGTGGHIFPAVSIANALRELDPEAKILFVGALGRMEMERVPQAGYKIIGLPVRGFNRAQPWKNISVVWDLLRSMCQARKIVRNFRPDVGVGVGGYASGAAMKVAAKMGVPILLQEQNGFAGVTNKLLKNDAKKICVAYEGMERFFPAEKIILTGNPVRQNLNGGNREEALKHFGLSADKKTLLIIGGSLGARTINESIIAALPQLLESDIQVIWQTGKGYYTNIAPLLDKEFCDVHWTSLRSGNLCASHLPSASPAPQGGGDSETTLPEHILHKNIYCSAFLSRMDLAYAAADLVISRAGASSISELCLLGKPCILVPSPNVAEDHQTHNAMALVRKDAAILVRDVEAKDKLVQTALSVIHDTEQLTSLHTNILTLAQRDSAKRIAEEVMRLAGK